MKDEKKYLRDVGTFRNYLKGERKIEKSDVLLLASVLLEM